MNDTPGSSLNPDASTFVILDNGESVSLTLSPRPLGLLWLVLAFNFGADVLYLVLGILYLVFQIPLFDGLPLVPPKLHSQAAFRWYIGFGIGWLTGLAALGVGTCVVWLPLLTHEQLTFAKSGIVITKGRPLFPSQFASDWLNVAEIRLDEDRLGVRQSRLFVTLLSGDECIVGENLSEANRAWLASTLQAYMARFGAI